MNSKHLAAPKSSALATVKPSTSLALPGIPADMLALVEEGLLSREQLQAIIAACLSLLIDTSKPAFEPESQPA